MNREDQVDAYMLQSQISANSSEQRVQRAQELTYSQSRGDTFNSSSDLTSPLPQSTKQKSSKIPRKPLSAYNLFFQLERENIINGQEGQNYTFDNAARVAMIYFEKRFADQPKRKHRKSHGKISFAELARTIANKWRALTQVDRDIFEQRAAMEKARHHTEVIDWINKKHSTPTEAKGQVANGIRQSNFPDPLNQGPIQIESLPIASSFHVTHGQKDTAHGCTEQPHVNDEIIKSGNSNIGMVASAGVISCTSGTYSIDPRMSSAKAFTTHFVPTTHMHHREAASCVPHALAAPEDMATLPGVSKFDNPLSAFSNSPENAQYLSSLKPAMPVQYDQSFARQVPIMTAQNVQYFQRQPSVMPGRLGWSMRASNLSYPSFVVNNDGQAEFPFRTQKPSGNEIAPFIGQTNSEQQNSRQTEDNQPLVPLWPNATISDPIRWDNSVGVSSDQPQDCDLKNTNPPMTTICAVQNKTDISLLSPFTQAVENEGAMDPDMLAFLKCLRES